MNFELLSLLVTLFFLAGIGTPVGYSILLASVVYLAVAGLNAGAVAGAVSGAWSAQTDHFC